MSLKGTSELFRREVELAQQKQKLRLQERNRQIYKVIRIAFGAIVFLLLVYFNLVQNNTLEDKTVYTTRTGSCYHRSGCKTLHSKRATTIRQAEKDGYSSCGVCCPDATYFWEALFCYGVAGCAVYFAFGIPISIINGKIARQELEEKKRKANEFRSKFDQADAAIVLGVPTSYNIGDDLRPKLKDDADQYLAVYAGSSAYHLKACRYAYGASKMSRFEARQKGLRPCKVCCPPPATDLWYSRFMAWAEEAHSLDLRVEIKDGTIFVCDRITHG